jgi:predicted ester cyclase
MSQGNIAVIRRWFEEVWNQGREETIGELLDGESVCYTDDGPIRGPDEFRERMYAPLHAAFPGLRVEIEAIVADGDVVVVRWGATGTHRGEGLGFAATHRDATFRGMTWVRIVDGTLREGWQCSNIPEVIRGLGVAASA